MPSQAGGKFPANVQNAACRPATFLSYIYNTIYKPLANNNNNSSAGMCAHGDSAGSAAVAYSLAYYGASSYLDNVELVSGPVLSDINQGCEVPSPQQSQWPVVCGLNGGNQYGCQLGGGPTWSLSPEYVAGAETGVGKWTNEPTCGNTYPLATSPGSSTRWLAQSIVDGGTGATPNFTYLHTGLSGWLCRSVVNDAMPPYPCSEDGNNNSNYCPNNSSPQGQLFYANIGMSNSPPNYAVYAADKCDSAEGVGGKDGIVPGFYPSDFQGAAPGAEAITYDMIGNPALHIPAQCIHRSRQ